MEEEKKEISSAILKERVLKLLEVKSIVTLVLVFSATYGFLTGIVERDIFAGWVGMILVYFFNKDRKDS